MKVIIKGNWSNCVGTDYCEALGNYESLEAAGGDALTRAWETWEPDLGEYNEETGEYEMEDDGPDYWLEEYIPGENGHDMHSAGGGSLADEFD